MYFIDADDESDDDQDENGDTAQEKRSIISCFLGFLQLTYFNNSFGYF